MTRHFLATAVLLLAALSFSRVRAAAPADAVSRLGHDLTPVGAERAGNADGSITPWSGGLTSAPSCFEGTGTRYCNPFGEDKPLFILDAQTLSRHRDHLTPGQLELFRQYGSTYRMPVYPTRRTFANPAFVYEAVAQNARSATLADEGESVVGARLGVPFPIPADGREVVWNHRLRYRDPSIQRWDNQFTVDVDGHVEREKYLEDIVVPYSDPNAPASPLLMQALQTTLAPARRAGALYLVYATLSPVKSPRAAWRMPPATERWVRWPQAGYDTPTTEAESLSTNDQLDSFNGAMDRYDWHLAGKREIFVPANAYELHDDRHAYSSLLRPHHLDPDVMRYELRRVWVVEADLRKGQSHVYARRVFYIDEDSWQIVLADLYDTAGKLWRVQETHTIVAYDRPYEMPVGETVYDLRNGRYVVHGLNNEEPETKVVTFDSGHFLPRGGRSAAASLAMSANER